jgi:hypothetical protein
MNYKLDKYNNANKNDDTLNREPQNWDLSEANHLLWLNLKTRIVRKLH